MSITETIGPHQATPSPGPITWPGRTCATCGLLVRIGFDNKWHHRRDETARIWYRRLRDEGRIAA